MGSSLVSGSFNKLYLENRTEQRKRHLGPWSISYRAEICHVSAVQSGNRKKAAALAQVRAARISNKSPRNLATYSATFRVWAGSHRLPRKGTGARNGQSVSNMKELSGI